MRSIGSRLHPITNVVCEYVLCDYVAGDAENLDVAENSAVTWVDTLNVTRLIPIEQIYPPVLDCIGASEVRRDRRVNLAGGESNNAPTA